MTWAHDRYVAAWLREVDAARHPIAFATWVEVSLRRDLLAPSSVRWSDGTLREVAAVAPVDRLHLVALGLLFHGHGSREVVRLSGIDAAVVASVVAQVRAAA